MKIDARKIATCAVLSALCAVTGALPFVFFIPVTVAVTALPLGMAAVAGLAFGIVSMCYSFILPTSLVSAAFIEAPYLAILPRICAAVCGALCFKLICKLWKSNGRGARVARAAIGGGITSALNTAFVVGLMLLIMPNFAFGGVTVAAYAVVMLTSGAIEIAVTAVLTPAVSVVLEDRVLLRGKLADKKRRAAEARYAERVGAAECKVDRIDTDNDGGTEKSSLLTDTAR